MKQHNPNTILEKMTPLCDAPLTVTSFLDSERRFILPAETNDIFSKIVNGVSLGESQWRYSQDIREPYLRLVLADEFDIYLEYLYAVYDGLLSKERVNSSLGSTPRRFFDRRKRFQIPAPLCEYARLEPGIEVWIELKRYWINIWSSQHRQVFEAQKSTKEQELWKIIIDILRMRFPF